MLKRKFSTPYMCINVCWCWVLSHSVCVRLFVTPWTAAHQDLLFMGFSRPEYWSGLLCPPPRDLPNPRIEPRSPALQVDSLLSEPPGKPISVYLINKKVNSSNGLHQRWGSEDAQRQITFFLLCLCTCWLLYNQHTVLLWQNIIKFLVLVFWFSFGFAPTAQLAGSQFPTRDWTWVAAVETPSPNHRTPREVPIWSFFFLLIWN